MVSINNISVSFGGIPLFEDVSFLINPKDKIGLAGKNGAGKSTLLKIIAGLQSVDSGSISYPNGFRIGYLPQDMKHQLGNTVFAETSLAFTELNKLQETIKTIEQQLANRTDYDSPQYHQLINELTEKNEQYTHLGGYTKDAEIERVLIGLGFSRSDFNRLTNQFSGGWRMRIELAKILLQKPDLLLLDEPTNHLDIESIQWLEDFLKVYSGAVVLVSHDKVFLDNLTNRTIEISLGKIYDYKANYSKYLQLRAERKQQQENAAKNQEKYIEHTQQLIDKYRYKATKASFAQNLIKKLEKLEKIEVDQDDNSSIHFKFMSPQPSGRLVLSAENISKSFDNRVVLKDISFTVNRGDKIAFVGKNGQGKSTLSKIIAGVLSYNGKLIYGHNVFTGYFAQNQSDELNPELTVYETIDNVATGEIRKQIRALLGAFLFSGDAINKKVKVLSGGEKGRLAMCKLLLQPYNLLVLDEPTNHLDIRSKEILKKAIQEFEGTVIVVSHDRDFLSGLTNKVFEFKNQTIKEIIGDINEYLSYRKIEALSELEKNESIKKLENNLSSFNENFSSTKISYQQKKEAERENRKIQAQIKKCEEEITRLESQIKQMDEQLQDPDKYKQLLNDASFFNTYDELKKQLAAETKQWELLVEKLT
jgi:ATP-binding cassette subfamily F protein 3